MSPSRFADEIGVQRSAMSHLVSGRNNPSLEFVSKVLRRFPEVNTEWLVTGTGSITRDPVTNDAPVPDHEHETGPEPQPEPITGIIGETAIAGQEPEIPQVPKSKKPVSKEKGTERIIIVYNDHTFRELYPEKD